MIDVWTELASRDYGYAQLPRYALGVSSGGAMALVLAKFFPLQVSQVLIASGVNSDTPVAHGLWEEKQRWIIYFVFCSAGSQLLYEERSPGSIPPKRQEECLLTHGNGQMGKPLSRKTPGSFGAGAALTICLDYRPTLLALPQ